MHDDLPSLDLPAAIDRPALPLPGRARWQPLRLGLVELYHYDSEEFWFRDGPLLLRGNNGTGKSKVLSLTLPFLLDARLLPSRIEPDGDAGKRMAWNLLMGSHDRRVGYAWIEFGRLADDGTPHYLTLGAGLSASAARAQVDSWFFVLDDAPQDRAQRLNQDLWLTSPQRQVLGKDRLREALAGFGQVFDTGQAYRRAVDERLFKLGPRRYDALMDTLIQLRAPMLSKKPDESALSNALTEALPPLAAELLHDVAEALGQLEEDRRQLETYQAMATAVSRFDLRYRAYAGAQSRRQARTVRQAQTEFDSASRARQDSLARQQAATQHEAEALAAQAAADLRLARSPGPSATRWVAQADAVLQRLPAAGLARAQLAAQALGDAHALDRGAPVATLVLAALRNAHRRGNPAAPDLVPDDDSGTAGNPAADAPERERELWAAAGMLVNELVCTDGMPAAAQRVLLLQLAAAGATLHYHGDFDWPGLCIANQVLALCGGGAHWRPWRFSAADYQHACQTGAARPLAGAPALAHWDGSPTDAMASAGQAIDEAALADGLLGDLAAA